MLNINELYFRFFRVAKSQPRSEQKIEIAIDFQRQGGDCAAHQEGSKLAWNHVGCAMEGLLLVPPERGTIIGRAVWKVCELAGQFFGANSISRRTDKLTSASLVMSSLDH